MRRTLLHLLLTWLSTGIIAGVVFLAAWRIDLPMVWAWAIGMGVLFSIATLTIDPDLAKERRKPGPGGRDFFMVRIAQPLLLGALVLAGLDLGRWHFSDTVPLWAQIAGLVVTLAGFGFAVWAMAVNRYFSPVIRHQTDRGHTIIDRGPYAMVRHPGYAGMIPALLATGVALGSWISTLPLAAFAAIMLRRTVLEDRFLLEELDGYREYAQRVRFRLIPGVW